VCLTTALHSPTSIIKAPRSLQGRIFFTLKPPFWTTTDLSVGASAGTHPPFSPAFTEVLSPPWATTFDQAPTTTFDHVRSLLFLKNTSIAFLLLLLPYNVSIYLSYIVYLIGAMILLNINWSNDWHSWEQWFYNKIMVLIYYMRSRYLKQSRFTYRWYLVSI
jgi:hypothetical protein